jgi:hypothetical protein
MLDSVHRVFCFTLDNLLAVYSILVRCTLVHVSVIWISTTSTGCTKLEKTLITFAAYVTSYSLTAYAI